MHIEPGVVEGAKIVLSYATAAAALGYAAKQVWETARCDGWLPLAVRSVIATLLVFSFFEVLPHRPVGVSEVHLIMGSTLLLTLGAAPAALGLAGGLLVQGLFFAPSDLPQYGMNVTTLLVPLFAIHALAQRIIPSQTRYVDIGYTQALKLSTAYQGGIVAWVAFWALYGHGLAGDNLVEIARFGAAYMAVVLLEPVVDLAVLALAKQWHRLSSSRWVEPRLYRGA
ncbi:energy-coupling factor ABC transporter permease [uncultured Tepidimonas sp.]|jgi:ABC-type Co2+ transport system permease subunit|uniref:energy-coupling factor ABC transporter permease n=1 Tax=uncultured Tepidimonas sp. TaxID=453579 RepID=UPI0026261CDD|nr:energy-coupling factor ABC transporter permease [uncultured Tepidimonas sp.]